MFSWFKKKTSAYPLNSKWIVMEGKNGNNAMIIRRNVSATELAGSPEYRHRVGVAIPLNAPNELGFPDSAESDQLNTIEDALNAALCENQNALQVLVITTSGMREFIYYTREPTTCPQAFDAVEAEASSHTIQAYVAEDPDWSVYAQFNGSAT